jgi:hypothetical protein
LSLNHDETIWKVDPNNIVTEWKTDANVVSPFFERCAQRMLFVSNGETPQMEDFQLSDVGKHRMGYGLMG